MSDDYPDDTELHARNSDPDTSHAAMAAYDKDKMKSAVDLMVALHKTHGPLADFQQRDLFAASWKTGCCDHLYQQARSVARDQGRIRDTGLRKVNPETKRLQIVWEACDGPAPVIELCPTCGAVQRPKKLLTPPDNARQEETNG